MPVACFNRRGFARRQSDSARKTAWHRFPPKAKIPYADVAHLVERHLAKVEVASSSLVGRSIMGKFSSAGRASALQAEGQRFESVNSHHGPVVQLVRTLACHARGRQFEPDPGRHMPL